MRWSKSAALIGLVAGTLIVAIGLDEPAHAQPGVGGGLGPKKPNPALTRWPPPTAPLPKGLPWKTPAKGTVMYTAYDASILAAADATELSRTLLAQQMYHIRYLSLHNIPEEFREWYVQVISLLLNSLSRNRDIDLPVALDVPAGMVKGAAKAGGVGGDDAKIAPNGKALVIRLNLRGYGIDPKAWDKQKDIDPYFQQKYLETPLKVKETTRTKVIEKKVPYESIYDDEGYWYKYADGSYKKFTRYKTVREEVSDTVQEQKAGKTETKQTPGAVWLHGPSIAVLAQLTQSVSPILRGDWWVVNGYKPPTYYDLLGLKSLDDAKELAAYDVRVEKITDSKATVVFSGSGGMVQRVARNNRMLRRINTAYGAWWETFDYKTSVKNKNVIHNFLNKNRDGGEIIWNLPNGLQGYALVDANDKLVEEVPIDIAVDYKSQDVRVINGRSCLWCHVQGMQPFKSDFKAQVTPKGLIDLGIKATDGKGELDINGAIKLAENIRTVFETPDFSGIVKLDNLRYNNAVKAATGQTAATMANRFLLLYDDYFEIPMNSVRLQWEAGRAEPDVKRILAVKLEGQNNGVLLRQLLTPPLHIRRDHWEEAYDTFARASVALKDVPAHSNLIPPVYTPSKKTKP